jgi:HK97 family phage major capsid protein
MADTEAVMAPVMFHREMELTIEPVETEAIEGEERAKDTDGRISISISSEKPVRRYDWRTGEEYFEVLEHGENGPDLSYVRDGMPLLLDHSLRVQVGLVENVRVEKDKKLRGEPRFGNHPDAGWVEKDMRGGIRKKISVGYDPGRTYRQVEGKDGALPTRFYRGWMPYEASTVAVPADYDVGVARSAFEGVRGVGTNKITVNAPNGVDAGVVGEAIARAIEGSVARDEARGLPDTSRKAEETEMAGNEQAPAAAPNAAPVVTRDYDAERKTRNKELGQLSVIANNGGLDGARLLSDALAQDWTPSQMAEEIHKQSAERASRGVPAGRVPMSDKEQREYSIVRAMREVAQSKLEGRAIQNSIEFEISRSIAEELKQQPKGIYVPLGLTSNRDAAAEARERMGLSRAAVTGAVVGTTSLGGVGVATEVSSMIELLRNSLVVKKAGIRTMDGLQGNVLFPRQTAANSWTWEGENPATAKADSAATFDSFTLSPKTGYGATAYSKQLLIQNSFSVEQWVREDLAAIAAVGIDLAVLHGLGSSNQPTGIFVLSGTGSVLFATDGAAPTWAKIVEFETTQATNNALQGNLSYISSPGIKGYLKTNLKNTVSGADYLLDKGDRLNDYPAYFTNQIRTNFTAGTSTTICHGVVFGNWSEGILASWGDVLDVTVDPYKYLDQGMIRVVESAMVDVGFRHPKSFVVATSAKSS